MSDNFVHLHTHTDYSKLDSTGTVTKYLDQAVLLGQPALGITDHGNSFGHMKFYEEALKRGIKPVLGCELYYAPGGRGSKKVVWGTLEDSEVPGRYTHLTAYALNPEGLRNLYLLQREATAEGFYYEPRCDLRMLADYSAGVAITTGCLGGATSTLLRLGRISEAEEHVLQLKEIFGDRLYYEVMSHGIPDEEAIRQLQVDTASKCGVPLLATNDCHYVHEGDASAHDAMLCLKTYALISDEKRFRFHGSGFHLRSRDEMESLGLPMGSLDETLRLAERVEDYSDSYAKQALGPRDLTGRDLAKLAYERLPLRLNLPPWEETPEVYKERMAYELETITSLGFQDYFLVLEDFTSYCHQEGIRVGPSRGSAGNSLVAFALGITDLDPIALDLLFERFLNPSRVSPPDIDIDVDKRYRQKVIDYLVGKYGEGKVAGVLTLSTIGAKAALKDANRVLGGSYALGNELVGLLPDAVRGRAPTLSDLPPTEHPDTVALAIQIEGVCRGTGQHASAIIVSPEEMANRVPMVKKEGRWVAGFVDNQLEALGYTKIDILGLQQLGIIDECLRTSGAELPRTYNDPKTLQLLSSGNTLGCFQVDGSGMRSLLRQVRPTGLGDVAAVLALYRPGPLDSGTHTEYANRKNGRSRVSYPHEEFASKLSGVLGPTYGLIVYQEQVMQILNVVCGWDYREAEKVFNALRKKDRAKLASAHPEYIAAGTGEHYSRVALDALWELLLPFADYSFNKAHSYGYATILYWTAYLKAHYPAHYMAALLTQEEDPKKLPEYIRETERMGVPILSPDVNESEAGWTVTERGELRRGLASIRGIGNKLVPNITAKQPYRSIDDFLLRVPGVVLNVGTIRALGENGAFGSLGTPGDVQKVCEDTERVCALANTIRSRTSSGSTGLWGSIPIVRSSVSSVVGESRGVAGRTFILSRPLSSEEWSLFSTALRSTWDVGGKLVEIRWRSRLIPVRISAGTTELPEDLLRALGITEEK